MIEREVMAKRKPKASNPKAGNPKDVKPNAAPQKTCRQCNGKVHVRNRVCEHCGYVFAPAKDKPLSTDESIDTVIMALKLVQQLGETEATKLIRKVAARSN